MTDIHVRTATPDDAAALFSLQPVPAATHVRELGELIQLTLKQYPFLVAEQDGQVLGYAYASAHRSLPAFRWSVDACVEVACQTPCVIQALYRSLIQHLLDQGFMAIYAGVAVNDHDSAALHRALGFAPIGLQQNVDLYCEADYWCLTLATTPARQEPVAFTVLLERLELESR